MQRCHAIDRCRRRRLARAMCERARPGLSDAHRQDHHSARPRRRGRHIHPRARGRIAEGAASAGRCREQDRRRAQHRDARLREAPPDGYTICVLSSEPVIYNQFLFKSLPFDPDKDFAPISNLFSNTLALVANNSLKVRTIPDLVALAKARPGTLSYGTFSFPLAHFMEKLKKETGADIVRVPFRSGSEVVTAVLSGSTSVAILALSNMVPQLQSSHIMALVVMSKTRSPLFPDVPTLAEARNGESYPSTWFGLFAPAGTPKPIIARLASEVARIVEERDFRQRMFIDRAVEPADARLDDFARFIRQERKVAERIVTESGVKPE